MAGSQNDKDYYVTLEVDRKADSDTIKKAYRRLALKFHPDRNKGNEKEAEEKFREIHEAYAILSDPQKRAEYDSKGVNGLPDRPAYQNTADLFGMFNTFFGGDPFAQHRHHFFNPTRPGFGNGYRSSSFHDFNFPSSSSSSSSSFRHSNFESAPPPPKPKQQHKVRLTVDVTFNESVVGCSKDISLEYTVKCSLCAGTGTFSGRVHDTMCGKCGGSGRLKETKGGINMSVTCPDCFGQGRRTRSPCLACTGGGRIQKIHQEEIVIPPGVSHGSAMKRVVDLDDENAEEELYEITVEINVENHKFFKRKGINVHLEVPISYTQAVLGDTVQVPCIYGGTLEVDIPPGTQPLSDFILIGQGFFNLEGNGQGDMILKWVLEVPKVISDEERKVLLNLSQLEHGDLPEKRVQFFQFMCDWDAESVL